MASVNKAILIGNLAAAPELHRLPSGSTVCDLRLATNDSFLGRDGQRKETTEWHRVKVWGKQAEACSQYLDKGRKVYVEGRIQTQKWDGKDGQPRQRTEIVAQRVQFLGGPRGGASAGGASGATRLCDGDPFQGASEDQPEGGEEDERLSF